ncbi:hypothetical protein [Haloferula sargassicola]|uniref:Secreted protein n=1 Tax=Haloferula sargassicola TaxID=490096 RepID=A0ABP9UMV9_9BACT
MIPPIIALVLALVVAFFAFQTSTVNTRMADSPTSSSMSSAASDDDSAAADDMEETSDEAPAEEAVDLE